MLCCSEGMLRNSESLISSQSSNSCCDPDASIWKRNSQPICIIWRTTCSNIFLQCPAPFNIFKCIRLANAICPAHFKPNASYEFCKAKHCYKITRWHISEIKSIILLYISSRKRLVYFNVMKIGINNATVRHEKEWRFWPPVVSCSGFQFLNKNRNEHLNETTIKKHNCGSERHTSDQTHINTDG